MYNLTNRIFIWFSCWAKLFDGIVGVLTFGFGRPKLELKVVKKLSKWRYSHQLLDK